ncbi:MAG: electron transfer flavoprotein subunit beta/FixA family protein [Gemmatimonadetes bacterium]|nr:electron transfer flavoprotein subunit beta/FixA family protein [Gemmatimonadota bacterium]
MQLTEKDPASEVHVISLGSDVVQETLRKALSMGVAKAVQLKCDAVPFDAFAVGSALAAELSAGGYDLIMFGKMSIDGANGATQFVVAELLGLPLVHACSKLEISGGQGTARREIEGGGELVKFSLPAIVSIDEGIARPRYPSLKGIMAAKKKPIEIKPAQLGDVRLTVEKMELPPARAAGRIIGEGAAAVPELVKLLQTEAKVL